MFKLFLFFFAFILSNDGWLTYSNSQNKFELMYPTTWIKKEAANLVTFLAPTEGSMDMFQENVNVMIQDLSNQPMTLDEFTNLSKNQVESLLGRSAILSLTNKTCFNQKCSEMIYVMRKDPSKLINLDLQIKQIWFIKSNKAYVLTYTAELIKFKSFLNYADKILNSFKMK